MAMELAEATLADEQRKKGWQVGYSEREERAYFFNAALGATQWESPADGVSSETDGPQAGPLMEQRPLTPTPPAGLIPPPTPKPARYTKDVFRFPESAGPTKRRMNSVSQIYQLICRRSCLRVTLHIDIIAFDSSRAILAS